MRACRSPRAASAQRSAQSLKNCYGQELSYKSHLLQRCHFASMQFVHLYATTGPWGTNPSLSLSLSVSLIVLT